MITYTDQQGGVLPAGAGVILENFDPEQLTVGAPRRCGGDPSAHADVSVD